MSQMQHARSNFYTRKRIERAHDGLWARAGGGDAVDLEGSVCLFRDVFEPLSRRVMNPSEKQMHVQATVGAHGSVTLDQLPYEPGQRVDVTISPIRSQVTDQTRRYSLSGLKVEFEQPFESVAADEWEATK